MNLSDAIQAFHQSRDEAARARAAFKRGEASREILRVADKRATRARLRYLELVALDVED